MVIHPDSFRLLLKPSAPALVVVAVVGLAWSQGRGTLVIALVLVLLHLDHRCVRKGRRALVVASSAVLFFFVVAMAALAVVIAAFVSTALSVYGDSHPGLALLFSPLHHLLCFMTPLGAQSTTVAAVTGLVGRLEGLLRPTLAH